MPERLRELTKKVLSANESAFSDDNQLIATVDGYEFEIYQDPDEDWYIQVRPESEGLLYDGWWPGSADKSLEEAVRESIIGSCIFGIHI